jgi:uncharacterized protein YchJ
MRSGGSTTSRPPVPVPLLSLSTSGRRNSLNWVRVGSRLEIVGSRKGRLDDSDGTVSFIARYSHNGTEGALKETSQFRRIDGRWLYWDRQREASAPRRVGVGRNDPCPCGSGKKHKKCCV